MSKGSVASAPYHAATSQPSRLAFTRNLNLRLGWFFGIPMKKPVFPSCHPFFIFCGVALKEKRIILLVERAGLEPASRAFRGATPLPPKLCR